MSSHQSMAEKIDRATRSRMMSGIRGRNTRPELQIRSALHGRGFRFRLHRRDLPGNPDVVLPRWRVVVFAHGCFWHGHEGCRYFRLPKTRADFWSRKISGNAERDIAAIRRLLDMGWRVAVVWECALRNNPQDSLDELVGFMRSRHLHVEIGTPPHQASAL